MNPTKKALIIGCGYLGVRIGQRLREGGYDVHATTRRRERLETLSRQGFQAVIFDLQNGAGHRIFQTRYDTVVYAVAPGRDGDPRLAFVDGLQDCLQSLRSLPPDCFVFLSSTGVYGQDDGAWVDEESPTHPKAVRPRILVDGEQLVLRSAQKKEVNGVVLRLAGLYGPSRSPVAWCQSPEWRERLARGNAEHFMNWVHADDAAQAAILAAEVGHAGEVYIIVDNEPVRRESFYGSACQQSSAPPLELTSDSERLGKRCSNNKAREQLGFEPQYPSYREGLAAL